MFLGVEPNSVRLYPAMSGVRASATLDQLRIRSPELGRSPFWERPSRALLDPEDLSGE
jgi:hypothetical protein